jgi:transcriptional regulator with PAS, ATPase and Fis domain
MVLGEVRFLSLVLKLKSMDIETLKSELIEKLKAEIQANTSEKEILYKLFFDMKKDVTELKRMFVEILQDEIEKKDLYTFKHEPLKVPSEEYKNNRYQDDEENIIPITAFEKGAIINALKRYKGSRKTASEALGISERTIYRKMKEYDIED